MNRGFILVEVLLATAISGILSVALLTAVYQVSKVQASVDAVIDVYTRAVLVHRQFDRDFSGATIPVQARPPKAKSEQKKQPEKKPGTDEKQAPEKKDQKPVSEQPAREQEQPLIKPLEKVFFVTQKEENIELITWISTNPMAVYWGAQTGHPTPRISRVVYRLQADNDGAPGTYKLVRQESDILEFEPYMQADSKIRSYELVSGIKKCVLSYIVEYQEKKEAEQTKDTDEKVPPEKSSPEQAKKIYKTFSTWATEEIQQLIKEKKISEVPQNIIMQLELADTRKKVRVFNFTFNRVTDLEPFPEKVDRAKQPQEKKTEQQKGKKNGAKEKDISVGSFVSGILKKVHK